MRNKEHSTILYTKELIAFAQAGVEFVTLVEQVEDKQKLLLGLLVSLPRLYTSFLHLPSYFYDVDEDIVESCITESTYEYVRRRIKELLATDDMYLTSCSADMQYSEAPLAVSLSEQIADIYQHIGNLLGVIRSENEVALPAAIGRCYLYWQEYWGQSLVSALTALHQIYIQELRVKPVDIAEEENE